MKPKRTISAYVLLAGIMGLSIVGGVLAFQIFLAVTKSQISTEQSTLTKSLDGTIDPKIMGNLKTRIKFTTAELNTVVSNASVTITPSPTATQGGNIVVAPSVTQGASPSAETQ